MNLRDSAIQVKTQIDQLNQQILDQQVRLQELRDQKTRLLADLAKFQAFFQAQGDPPV